MQINNVGNGTAQHHHNMHQVTNCKHEQSVSQKGASAAASSSKESLQKYSYQSTQQQEGFSLSYWWKKLLAAGQKLYISVWGEAKDGSVNSEASVESSGETANAAELAGTALSKPDLHNNPYFSAIEDKGKQKQTVWKKVHARFKAFTGQNSFETKQQKSKQDLRKHSRYRQDDLEIDCILTDDSYLLDSYDRKGEYSKLSPKK